MENIEKRLEIFNDLKATGSFEKISLDLDNAKDVIRIMDTLVVRLEGGSAEDVEALKLEKIEDESLEDINKGNEELKNKPKEGEEDAISDGEVPETEAEKRKKMLLHKTSSIFLRNVPPSVTISELEAIRDSDLNAIINRDLTRRIRTTNGITAHKQVAQNDLRQAVKLVALLDKRVGLFTDEPAEEREKDIRMGVNLVGTSKNPLIKEVRDILMDIEEVSPEEEELLVHSVDFYNHGEYPNEDSMPNRCGMLHVRGQTPSASQWGADEDGTSLVSNKFITDFTNGFNQRLENSLIHRDSISEEEMERLGKKDGEKEVETFIQQNTVELAKDKWLCPLSGKKFKGPEFIRKHLMSKHDEKLSEVKHEATFYNNYLADAKRPVDAEPKITPVTSSRDGDDRREDRYESRGNYSERVRPPPPRYDGYGRAPQRDYVSHLIIASSRFEAEGRRDPRPQVTYRDLDAPEDIV
uniref:ARS2 domain-containing protein n=1 Tax=Heterorhabditis bacteriophora TaxID=37862 RepID=A0A1I7XTJ3_HETBA